MKIKRPAPMPRPVVRKLPPKLKINASIARSRSSRVHDEDDDYYDTPEPNMKLSHAFVVVLVLHVIAVGGVFAFNTIKSNQRPNIVSAAAETPVSNETPVTSEVAPPVASGIVAPPSAGTATQVPVTQPAVVQQAVAAKPAATTGATHEVKSGETLIRIATQYGVSVAALQEANAIEDPTKIRIGTQLVIPKSTNTAVVSAPPTPATTTQVSAPVVANVPPKPVTPATTSPATKDSGEIYEVAKGDNPVSIARKLNVSYNDLLALNNIDDPRRLQIGQKLKVPAAK